MSKRIPRSTASESEREVCVKISRYVAFELPETTPEQAARMEEIRKLVGKRIEAYWDGVMQSLVRAGHAPEKPRGYVSFKSGDLS